jgi:hypothetical protein
MVAFQDNGKSEKDQAKTELKAVNVAEPCPVCEGDRKCSLGADGLILCGRSRGDVPGFISLGEAERDPQWWIYRHASAAGKPEAPAHVTDEARRAIDWGRVASALQANLTPSLASGLGESLGLPSSVFEGLDVGYDSERECWTCPERDGTGTVVGINRRYRGGNKRMVKGGSRGLYYARDWASSDGPILCPEGFSDTAALLAMDLAAVGRPSNTGGLEPLANLLSTVPDTRAIIVIGENDQKLDGRWPGRDGAIATAESLARLLRRPIHYTFPPAEDKDVRAWFQWQDPDLDDAAGQQKLGKTLLTKLWETAREAVCWDPPIPFGEADLPRFPTEALTPWLRDYVEAVATASQTPVDLAGMLVLSAIATACARRMVVVVSPDHVEPVNLFVAVAMPSGSRKTAVFGEVTRPIEVYERELAKEAPPRIAAAQSQLKVDERTLDVLQGKAAKAEGAEREELLRRAEELAQDIAKRPLSSSPRLGADDITAERLAGLMALNEGRMAVLSPEGGPFDMIAGRYRSSKQSMNIDVYLKGHGGDTHRIDRQGRPPEFIERPALTFGLAVQPGVIRGLSDQAGFRERGLLARFLFALPPSYVGRRVVDPPSVPPALRDAYLAKLRALLALKPVLDESEELVEHRITLSPGARTCWLEFARRLEPQLDEHGSMGHMADWGSKLAGAAARIAGLLHAADLAGLKEPWSVPIPAETMARAVQIGEYLIPHARAAFDLMGCDPTIADARYVLAWVRKHEAESFTKRDCFEATKGRFKRVETLEPALRLLAKHGYIRERSIPGRHGPGRPASPVFDVNPETFKDRVPGSSPVASLRYATSEPSDAMPAIGTTDLVEAHAPSPAEEEKALESRGDVESHGNTVDPEREPSPGDGPTIPNDELEYEEGVI